MVREETKFLLQLGKGHKVVINVKVFKDSQAFIRLVCKSNIHHSWFKARILTNSSMGTQSWEIQNTLNLP